MVALGLIDEFRLANPGLDVPVGRRGAVGDSERLVSGEYFVDEFRYPFFAMQHFRLPPICFFS